MLCWQYEKNVPVVCRLMQINYIIHTRACTYINTIITPLPVPLSYRLNHPIPNPPPYQMVIKNMLSMLRTNTKNVANALNVLRAVYGYVCASVYVWFVKLQVKLNKVIILVQDDRHFVTLLIKYSFTDAVYENVHLSV